MQRLKLLNLETLCWIARLGTFTAAANRLNTTQPAISKRMKELEQAFGAPLFHRVGRNMELNMHARALVQQAQPLITRLEDLAISLDRPAAATGIIRIGVGEIVALTWFGDMMARLKREMPNVNYQIEVGLTVDMLHQLETAKLDVAILAGPIANDRIASESLGCVDVRWLVAPELRRQLGKASVKEMFEAAPVWSVGRPSHMQPMAMKTLRRYGVRESKLDLSDSLGSLVALAARGAGIAFLPVELVSQQMKDRKLEPLSPELPAESLEFVIARHRDDDQIVIRRIVERAVETTTFAGATDPQTRTNTSGRPKRGVVRV